MRKTKLPHKSLTPELIREIRSLRIQCVFRFKNLNFVDEPPHDSNIQDIITLLDSPKFLLKVRTARDKLGIDNVPFNSPSELMKKAKVKTGLPKDIDPPYGPMRQLAITLSDHTYWQRIVLQWHGRDHQKMKDLIQESQNILLDLNRPVYLIEAVMQAILCGIVGWNTDPLRVVDNTYFTPIPQYAIILNPRQTYIDIEDALRRGRELVEKQYPIKQSLSDTTTNLWRYHNWYWQKLEDKTYIKIAAEYATEQSEDTSGEEYDEKYVGIGENEVYKGVKKYTSLLDF